jgi:hypothetical protein
MADHPLQTARIMVEALVRQVAGPGTDTVGQYFGASASIPLVLGLFSWNAVLWAFAAVGAVAGLRSGQRVYWAFVIATIGYVILISLGDAGYARYRIPVIPLLALLATNGIRWSVRGLRSRRRHPAGALEPPLGSRTAAVT